MFLLQGIWGQVVCSMMRCKMMLALICQKHPHILMVLISKVEEEILTKVEDAGFQSAIFDALFRIFKASPNGQVILSRHVEEVKACWKLFTIVYLYIF